MSIVALWSRWIETLAGLVIAMQEGWRARRVLTVALEDKRVVLRSGSAVATHRPRRQPSAAALAALARRHFITLELPAHEAVLQRINVPARAREFLPGIVRNQIERLSPWPADQVVYGFDAAASAGDAETLDARVVMASRATVETARNELAALGVTADRIVAGEAGGAPPVALWSRFDGASGRGLERARRKVAAAVLVTVLASAGVSAWALVSASAIRAESDDAAESSAALQKRLQPARAAAPSPSLAPPERAWALKETAPAGALVLDALSQALPDSAYLTELTLQKSTVRLVGLTSDAPALIAPLEHFGQFAEVRFFAPTTRGPDGRLFWFHIEARVEPHNGAED